MLAHREVPPVWTQEVLRRGWVFKLYEVDGHALLTFLQKISFIFSVGSGMDLPDNPKNEPMLISIVGFQMRTALRLGQQMGKTTEFLPAGRLKNSGAPKAVFQPSEGVCRRWNWVLANLVSQTSQERSETGCLSGLLIDHPGVRMIEIDASVYLNRLQQVGRIFNDYY